MSEDLVDIAIRSIEGWNRGDFEQWAAFTHPEVEWRPQSATALLGEGEVYTGREGLRRWWEEMRAAFDDVGIDIAQTSLVAPQAVFVTGTGHGRGRGAGVPVEWPIAVLLEFRDELMVRGRSWFDVDEGVRAAEALAQSGRAR